MRFGISLLLCSLIITATSHAGELVKKQFNFLGYETTLKSIARDGAGHIVIIGTIKSVAERERRSVTLDSLITAGNPKAERAENGIIIATTDDFRMTDIKIIPFERLMKVVYDEKKGNFLLMGSLLSAPNEDYKRRPMIQRIVFGKEKPGSYKCTIERSGVAELKSREAQMEDMVNTAAGICLLSTVDTVTPDGRRYIPAIITLRDSLVSAGKYNNYQVASVKYLPVKPIQCVVPTPFFTDKSGAFYLAASTCQFADAIGINTFKYKNGTFTRLPFKTDAERPFMTNIMLAADGSYLCSYARVYSDKYFTMEKADKNFRTLWKTKVNLHTDPSYYSKLIEMPDGKIIAPITDSTDSWSYNIYDKNGKLMQTISTGEDTRQHVYAAFQWDTNSFVSIIGPLSYPGISTVQIFSIDN